MLLQAKTTAAKTLTDAVNGKFSRIQCTPDLLPCDIIGTQIFNYTTNTFETKLGPVYANFVLLDEINRSSAKTQSAMLEVMQEHQTTIGGYNYAMPKIFTVIATQNPVESQGIFQAMKGLQSTILVSEFTLGTEWEGEDPFTQVVTIPNATQFSLVTIQADDEALAQLINDGVRAIWIENDDGAFTAHAIGGVNSVELTLQCTLEDTTEILEVGVIDDILVFPGSDYPTVVDDVLLL